MCDEYDPELDTGKVMKLHNTSEPACGRAVPDVTLITRVDCHLCHEAETLLRRLAGELGFRYLELDVDADPERRAEYSDRVPVILVDGREHGYWRVEEARFRRAVSEAH